MAFQVAVWKTHGIVPSSVRAKLKARKPVKPARIKDEPDVEQKPLFSMRSRTSIIIQQVCEKHGVSRDALRSERRDRKLVYARHEAFYLIQQATNQSLPQIGAHFNRDHTTVLAGIRAHVRRMEVIAP